MAKKKKSTAKRATAAKSPGTEKAPAKKNAKKKKPSGLDAAARVLAETGRPMSAKQLVEAMLAKKYWSSGGQTPHATISSAMQREIQNKGQQSRFRKTAPGRFALAKSKA